MKKLTAVFSILLTVTFLFLFSSSLFAEPKSINIYTEIPFELRGTWYSLWFSDDQGKTEDKTYQPLFVVTRKMLGSQYFSDFIVSAEKLQFNEGIGYALYSEDKMTVYLVMFYTETGDLPIVYVFKNKKEQYRSCIEIKRI